MPVSAAVEVDYEIWPDHQQPVMTFLRCQTQWRTSSGGVIGLDYNVVLAVMALYDVPDRVLVLEDVQVMEHRAIELLNEKAQKESRR